MNFKLVLKITGKTLLVVALCMVVPLLVTLYYGEPLSPFLYSIGILVVLGTLLARLKAEPHFFSRESFFTVGLIWILFGIFGALPFWFSGYFETFVDCVFESISGFTTTGASILKAVENLPRGILFWRSFTHWLGGMGVLILTIALLPSLGISGTQLAKAETPGPVVSKLVPKASDSSKILYAIYLVMTIFEVICLLLTGMPLFDCVTNSFATAGTGGFSVRNLSIGAYNSPAAEVIITVFMLLFSLNFSVYFLLLCGKWRQALKSDELRFFGGIVGASIVLVTVNISGAFANVWEALRHAAFQVGSIISTTGFSSTDFDGWPQFSRVLLVVLMFVGACAGSTGGAMKCSRILVICKSIGMEIRQIIHPRSVNVVKLDGEVLSDRTLHSIQVFFGAYLLIILGATMVIALDNFSFGTTFTAVVSCIGNVGPGLELVGPMGNYAAFSPFSKIILTACMVIGRLEVFPILVLFSSEAWVRR